MQECKMLITNHLMQIRFNQSSGGDKSKHKKIFLHRFLNRLLKLGMMLFKLHDYAVPNGKLHFFRHATCEALVQVHCAMIHVKFYKAQN